MSRLEEIRARCEKATPGPWDYDGMHPEIHARGNYLLIICDGVPVGERQALDECGHTMDPDFAFIAHAREDIPYLLDRLKHAEAVSEATGATLNVADPTKPVALATGLLDRACSDRELLFSMTHTLLTRLERADAVARAADDALYQIQRLGRNAVQMASGSMIVNGSAYWKVVEEVKISLIDALAAWKEEWSVTPR